MHEEQTHSGDTTAVLDSMGRRMRDSSIPNQPLPNPTFCRPLLHSVPVGGPNQTRYIVQRLRPEVVRVVLCFDVPWMHLQFEQRASIRHPTGSGAGHSTEPHAGNARSGSVEPTLKRHAPAPQSNATPTQPSHGTNQPTVRQRCTAQKSRFGAG